MKKVFLIILIVGYTVSGQNFFESEYSDQEQTNSSPFSAENQPPDNPDIGVDEGNPGPPIPIDHGWLLLLSAGLSLGIYFLNTSLKKKTT